MGDVMSYLIEWPTTGGAQLVDSEADAEFFARQGARITPIQPNYRTLGPEQKEGECI
jgi:hypothetical protein